MTVCVCVCVCVCVTVFVCDCVCVCVCVCVCLCETCDRADSSSGEMLRRGEEKGDYLARSLTPAVVAEVPLATVLPVVATAGV